MRGKKVYIGILLLLCGVFSVKGNTEVLGCMVEYKPDREPIELVIQAPVDSFSYYQIPEKYSNAGGYLPEEVQRYLWDLCKERDLDYYIIIALIERESDYKSNASGDNGNSKGYMQVQERWHRERMEAEAVEDLYDPYGNVRVGLNFLQELYEKHGASGTNCVLMVYNMGEQKAIEHWKNGVYSTEYSREILYRAQEIKQEIAQD